MEELINENTPEKHNVKSITKKQLLEDERKSLQLLLIDGANSLIQDKYSDEYLDRQNEKIKLISGVEISLKSVRELLSSIAQNHPPQFDLELYTDIFRIMKLDGDPSAYFKPKEVAIFTNEVIYGRFDKDILPTLQRMNNYVGFCIRAKRHYHFFNDEGIHKLQIFIEETKQVMKDCNDYYEFRVKMFESYGVPYQIRFNFSDAS